MQMLDSISGIKKKEKRKLGWPIFQGSVWKPETKNFFLAWKRNDIVNRHYILVYLFQALSCAYTSLHKQHGIT